MDREELIEHLVNHYLIFIYEGAYKGSPSVDYEEFCRVITPILRKPLEAMNIWQLEKLFRQEQED